MTHRGPIPAFLSILVFAALSASGQGVLVNGNFETGDLTGWTEMPVHYPGSDTTVFDDGLGEYPMLSPYAGAFSCGWVRNEPNWTWPGHDSTKPSNSISQTITNAPGTYPVTVSAAFFVHHNRRGEPEDNWGTGIALRIFVDGETEWPAWEHSLWPREAESFWKYHRSLDNEIYEGAPNQITTTTGLIRFEIAWITKWTIDQDICAIDNVQLEFGPPGDDPYDDPLQPAPEYVVPPSIGPAEPGFGARTLLEPAHYPVGMLPVSILAADFNGDGAEDLATANYWQHTISILLNEGDGRFGPAQEIPCGHNPRKIVATDVNTDHRVDLVVSCHGDAKVQTFLGDGDGGFSDPIDTPTPEAPWRIGLGQLNADGLPDLVVPSEVEDRAYVYMGNGDGTFTQSAVVQGDDMTSTALLADYDGNPGDDLLLLSWWDATGRSYRNDGNGSLTLRDTVSFPWQTESAVFGDFNDDGFLDVCGGGAHSAAAAFFLGNGDGSFNETPETFKPRVPTDFCTGSWDGDGLIDVASSNFDVNEFELWKVLNVWQEDVKPAASYGAYASGRQPRCITSSDFNGDGIPDIAVGAGDDYEVLVFLGQREGLWDGSTTHFPGGFFPEPRASAAGDFDGDEDLDVAAAVVAWGEPLFNVLRNDGHPPLVFLDDSKYDPLSVPEAVAAGDFDEDGDDDVAIAARFVRLFRCNGDLTFTYTGYKRAGSSPMDLLAEDLNGDGHLDLVSANSGSDDVSVLPGYGNGTFGNGSRFGVGDRPEAVCAGPLDDSPGLDLATADAGADTVSLLSGNGSGSFTLAGAFPVGDEPVDIACGDIDGDGNVDLVTANRSGPSLSILYSDGEGGFLAAREEAVPESVQCVAAADFTGDGKAEIAAGLVDTPMVILLVRGTDGTFRREYYTAVGTPRKLDVAPIWGRPLPDLLCTPEDVTRLQILAGALGPDPRFTAIERDPAGEVVITWTGPTGTAHAVERADAPETGWSTQAILAEPQATNRWTDVSADAAPESVYRIRLER